MARTTFPHNGVAKYIFLSVYLRKTTTQIKPKIRAIRSRSALFIYYCYMRIST